MKHLKKFENFGRFENDEEIDNDLERRDDELENDFEDNEFRDYSNEDNDYDGVCPDCGLEECECEVEDEEESEESNRRRRWGDEEIVEKKKINPGFQAYLDKQNKKKEGKEDKAEDKKSDKKDKKSDKEEKPEELKGLTAKQKKLPIALQNSILKKKK